MRAPLFILFLCAVAWAQQHTIVITGNATTGVWAVDGTAATDLELIIGAQYRFDVRGEGIDEFFVALPNTTRIHSCGPSPCFVNAEFTAAQALLDLIYGIDDNTGFYDLVLSSCDILDTANECGNYSELCAWCQSSLVCQDSAAISCNLCTAVPLATCGNASTSPGCSICATTGGCLSSTQTCPPCDTEFTMTVGSASECDVDDGQVNVTATCVATLGCTLSVSPSAGVTITAVPGVGWRLTTMEQGEYTIRVTLSGCYTSKLASIGPTVCDDSSSVIGSLSTPDDTPAGIAWWAWLILGIGIVLVAAIIVGAIWIGRRISNTRRNNQFFSGSEPTPDDEGLSVLGGNTTADDESRF